MTNVKLNRGMACTAYHVLGCPPGATDDELHAAWIALAMVYAPRKLNDDEVHISKANAAYGLVKNSAQRKLYDAKLTGVCAACKGRGSRPGFVEGEYVKKAVCVNCQGTGWAKC